MKFAKPLYASLAILSLAVPVTGAALVTLSAGPVMAKGGNGKGGGSDRGGRSDRGDKGDRGKSRGGQGGSGKGQGKGQDKGAAAAPGQAKPPKPPKPAKPAAVTTPETTEGEGEVTLHPSELGSMNGAMNANINAVLAHIRNGNTNGPVGALAGLAVAEHNAAEAETVLETAAAVETLATALADAGYDNLEDYEAALADGETEAIAAIDDAVSVLGEDAGGAGPGEDEIAEAEAALEALTQAEAAIMETWNKSGAATDDQKAALLDALRDRLEAESEAIAAAVEAADADDSGDGETAADDEETGEETGEDVGDAADDATDDTLDPETQAMLDNLDF